MSWFLDPEINSGYPFNTEFPSEYQEGFISQGSIKYPYSAWRIQSGTNDGYPFTWYMFPDRYQPHYIEQSRLYNEVCEYHIYWNESLKEAIEYFLEYIENNEKNIDSTYYKKVDLESADAGKSFVESPWVAPFISPFGEYTYDSVRNGDQSFNALTKDGNMQYTCIQAEEIPVESLTDEEPPEQIYKWLRLLMPKNSHTVEVEDLNRNFWVISMFIEALSAYLWDDNGQMPNLLKRIFEEVTQLWENIAYLWMTLAAATQKKNNHIHIEVLPLSNKLISHRKFDNFEQEIPIVSEIIERIDYLKDKYSESDIIALPFIRGNNYQRNWYSKEIYPYLFYFTRADNQWHHITLLGENNNPLCFSLNPTVEEDIDEMGYTFAHKIGAAREDEEDYSYCQPFTDIHLYNANGKRLYGLLRVVPDIEAEILNGILTLNKLDFNIYDAAREIETEQLQFVATIGGAAATVQDGDTVICSRKNVSDWDTSLPSIALKPVNKNTFKYYQGEVVSYYETTQSRVPIENLTFETINIGHFVPVAFFYGSSLSWSTTGDIYKYGANARTITISSDPGVNGGDIKFLPNYPNQVSNPIISNLISSFNIFNDNEHLKNLGVEVVSQYITKNNIDTSTLRIYLTHMGLEPWGQGDAYSRTCVWYKGYYGTLIAAYQGAVKHLGFVKRVEGFWNGDLWRGGGISNVKARQYQFKVLSGAYDPNDGTLTIDNGIITINDINRQAANDKKICDYNFTISSDGSSLLFNNVFNSGPINANNDQLNTYYEDISAPSATYSQSASLSNIIPNNTIPPIAAITDLNKTFCNRGVQAGTYVYT